MKNFKYQSFRVENIKKVNFQSLSIVYCSSIFLVHTGTKDVMKCISFINLEINPPTKEV